MARELPTPEVHIVCDDAGNPIIYRESYGIRAIERRLGQVKQGGAQPAALQKLNQLIAAARREVATLCDLSDLEVISAAVDPAAARTALCAWVEAIINKSPGLLSKPAVAAQFLAAMHNLQSPPPPIAGMDPAEADVGYRLIAGSLFAHAWHHWDMEVSGEHRSAAAASRSARGLAGGMAGVQKKRRSRETIILRVIGSEIDRKGARLLRKKYFNQISNELPRKLTDEALEQAIKRIQARRKDKAGKRRSK
jgi:hypothetical protein